jgi:P pilus assembly chaperone PapD
MNGALLKLAILSSILVATGATSVRADGTRTVGVVAISYTGTRIDSLSSAIAVGKNSAAATASITGTETAASAIGSAGRLTVTNPDTTSVSYQVEADNDLGTSNTNPVRSTSRRIDSISGGTNQAVTIMNMP